MTVPGTAAGGSRALPLRRGLLAGLVLLTATATGMSGAANALALRAYLLHRTDDQLAAAAALVVERSALAADGVTVDVLRRMSGPTDYLVEARLADGSCLRLSGGAGTPSCAVVDRLEAPADGGVPAPRTVAGTGYRAVAVRADRGVVAVGLPVAPVAATVARLLLVEAAVGAVALVLLALAVRALLQRALLPVERLTAAATAIAAGDLDRPLPEVPGGGWAAAGTEVGRLTAALAAMLDRLRAALADRDRVVARQQEFAADASHELRTPLTAVRGYVQLLRRGMVPATEVAGALRRAEDETDRMAVLVDDLLFLARPGAGCVPTDLAGLVRGCVADALAADGDHPLRVEAPASCPVTVDAVAVRRVLVNLLANVRVHTPPGTGATVRLRRMGPAVVVEVHDRGPGVPETVRDRVLERFVRADPTVPGSGLGLAIVADVVRAHGGRVRVDVPPEGGTRVRFSLQVRNPATGG